MDLFEYQARDVFEKHGVPVLAGAVATTPEEARAAAERMRASGGVTVVKAQVKAGGRGKAGGVKVAKTADEAEERRAGILGMDIKGHTVTSVMIAPAPTSPRSTTLDARSTGPTAATSRCARRRAAWTSEQLAVERPRRWPG